MKTWIVVASKDHLDSAVAGGFIQAGHGKLAPMKRLAEGDMVIGYSSKVIFGEASVCQQFTALGTVVDSEIFQVEQAPGFSPYRRRVDYQVVQQVDIRSLIDSLNFIKNKQHWGYPFRTGLFSIPDSDAALITQQMRGSEQDDAGKPDPAAS